MIQPGQVDARRQRRGTRRGTVEETKGCPENEEGAMEPVREKTECVKGTGGRAGQGAPSRLGSQRGWETLALGRSGFRCTGPGA